MFRWWDEVPWNIAGACSGPMLAFRMCCWYWCQPAAGSGSGWGVVAAVTASSTSRNLPKELAFAMQWDVGWGWKEWITATCQMCPASHQFISGVHNAAVCACSAWEGNHHCSWDPWEHNYLVQAQGWCVKLVVLSDFQDGHISVVLCRIGLKIWGLYFSLLPLNFPFV